MSNLLRQVWFFLYWNTYYYHGTQMCDVDQEAGAVQEEGGAR